MANGREDLTAGLLTDTVTNEKFIVVVGGKGPRYKSMNSVEILYMGENNWVPGMDSNNGLFVL